MADHRGRHNSDGPGAGDQHVFAQHVEGQSGVYRIAKGIENSGDVAIDARIVTPDIGHRQSNELGETTRPVHAHARSVRAQVAAPGHAIAAAAAHHVPFARDQLARVKIDDVGADFHDLADEFMADRHRDRDGLASPLVPIVDVNIRAANSGAVDPNQNVVNAD